MIAGVQCLHPGVHRWQIEWTPQAGNAPQKSEMHPTCKNGVHLKLAVSLLEFFAIKYADLAQLVEQLICNQ